MAERFKLPAAVFLFFIKDGKVLLLRRQNTGWCDGSYDLPAGHIDGGESFTATACREAKEELGVAVDPKDVAFAHMVHGFFTQDDKEYLYVVFTVKQWQGEPRIGEPEKCDDLQWFALDNPPQNLTPGTELALRVYKTGTYYSETGFAG